MKQKITKSRVHLLTKEPFFGTLLLQMQMTEDTQGAVCTTMATDGKHIFWHPPFIERCSFDEVLGVMVHEILHVVYLHHLRQGPRDAHRWNIACDAVINHVVLEAGYKLPEPGIHGPKWAWTKNLGAEEVYDRMPQDQNTDEGIPGGVISNPGMSESDRAMAEQAVKIAVAQAASVAAARAKGNLPGWMKALVDEILNPKVPWEDVLRRFFSAQVPFDQSWARPNRRFVHTGVYLPGPIREGIGEGVIYVDTSGSCWQDRPQFWGEINKIISDLKPIRVHVVQCDAGVGDFRTYEMGEEIDPNVVGGGGSNFRPAFEAVNEAGIRPEWAVVLSDMMIDFPDRAPDYPVIMVSTMTTHRGPDWGSEHICIA